MALLDILGKKGCAKGPQGDALKDIRKGIDSLGESPGVQKALTALLDDAGDDINKVRQNIHRWFDDSMDRVAGWYTRRIQSVSLVVALLITLLFNVNTIEIAAELWREPGARAMLVERVDSLCPDGTALEECMATLREAHGSQLPIPLGWQEGLEREGLRQEAIDKLGLIGWPITALAISLGAPFWFGLLVKLRSIRTTGIRPEDRPRTMGLGS